MVRYFRLPDATLLRPRAFVVFPADPALAARQRAARERLLASRRAVDVRPQQQRPHNVVALHPDDAAASIFLRPQAR